MIPRSGTGSRADDGGEMMKGTAPKANWTEGGEAYPREGVT